MSDAPVSTRRVFQTLLDWAGLETADSLRAPKQEIVLGEAMKPFLAYGWQPQVMAVEGRLKVIQAGRQEVYDVVADPREAHDLAASAPPSRPLRTALLDYPTPSTAAPPRGRSARRGRAPQAREPRLRQLRAQRPSSARTRRGPST